jgi:hypothetical protein
MQFYPHGNCLARIQPENILLQHLPYCERDMYRIILEFFGEGENDFRQFDTPQNPLLSICPALRSSHLAVAEAGEKRTRISDGCNSG